MDESERRHGRQFWMGTAAGVAVGVVVIAVALGAVPSHRAVIGTPSASPTQTLATVTGAATPSLSATPTAGAVVTDAAGVVTGAPKGTYVTIFKWMYKNATSAEQAAAYAATQSKNGFTVVAVDGDSIGGLEPGRYAIGVVGAPTFADSKAVCVALGLPADGRACWSRPITR